MTLDEDLLPPEHLLRATRRGNEYAWRLEDIPKVIEAARQASLLNIGGQLQFRIPEGTCECYWVEVNAIDGIALDLPWRTRVELSAETALSQFRALPQRFDFLAEGRSSFGPHFDRLIAAGASPTTYMCFVWSVQSQRRTAGLDRNKLT